MSSAQDDDGETIRQNTIEARDVADSSVVLETGGQGFALPAGLGDRLAASRHGAGLTLVAPEIREYVLRDVVLDGRSGVLFHDGRAIKETLMRAPKRLLLPDFAAAEPVDAGLRPALGFNGMWFNYYHWLIEAVPAIHAGINISRSADAIVLRRFDPFLPQLSQMLDLANVQVVRPPADFALRFDRLIYSTFLTGAHSHAPSELAKPFYRSLATKSGRRDSRREIYIYRGGKESSNRPMLNEDELVERLSAMGVGSFKLEAMSQAEQIELFASASLVVAAHGAGLANLVFCPPGCKVVELRPDTIFRQEFAALAVAYDLPYFVESYPTTNGAARNGPLLQWAVDVDDVARRITEIRRSPAL